MVEAIVSLGKGLSVPVTAEGIENSEVLGQLQGMGDLKGRAISMAGPKTPPRRATAWPLSTC